MPNKLADKLQQGGPPKKKAKVEAKVWEMHHHLLANANLRTLIGPHRYNTRPFGNHTPIIGSVSYSHKFTSSSVGSLWSP